MRKLAKAPVTPKRQSTQYNCTATSLSMCLIALGLTEAEASTGMVNKVLGSVPMKGASWEQILAAAQHYGIRSQLVVPATLSMIKEWTTKGLPVMISWTPNDRPWAHASVIFDVDDQDNVWIADPNLADPQELYRVMPAKEFYSKWHEKWESYLVRRPACVLSREIDLQGRQVIAGSKQELKNSVVKSMNRKASFDWEERLNNFAFKVLAADIQYSLAANQIVTEMESSAEEQDRLVIDFKRYKAYGQHETTVHRLVIQDLGNQATVSIESSAPVPDPIVIGFDQIEAFVVWFQNWLVV